MCYFLVGKSQLLFWHHITWILIYKDQTRVTFCCQLGVHVCEIALSSFYKVRKVSCVLVFDLGSFTLVLRLWLHDSSSSMHRNVCVCCNNRWGSPGDVLEEVERFSWGKRIMETHSGFLRCQQVQVFVLICFSSFLPCCKNDSSILLLLLLLIFLCNGEMLKCTHRPL